MEQTGFDSKVLGLSEMFFLEPAGYHVFLFDSIPLSNQACV